MKLDEQTDRQIAELEEMAAQVYAALAHHRADALRRRIEQLKDEARAEGDASGYAAASRMGYDADEARAKGADTR